MVIIVVLTASNPASTARAAFPGRNGKIVVGLCCQGADQQWSDLLVTTPTGENADRLTRRVGWEARPRFNPVRDLIVYERGRRGHDDLALIRTDGSRARYLTHTDGRAESSPAWSPDGLRVAFRGVDVGSGEAGEIYIMDLKGEEQIQVTDNALDEVHLRWSPDGTSILFAADVDGNGDIYVVPSEGGQEENITSTPDAHETAGDWAPDMSRIVFARDRDLYLMNPDGTDQILLIADDRLEDNPVWSPNGEWILYDTFEMLRRIRPDGTGDELVYRNRQFNVFEADWGPMR
jgi:Tol biopolymer transport system component